MAETFNFVEDFQDLILATAVRKPENFILKVSSLKSHFFTGVIPHLTAKSLISYYKKYGDIPKFNTLAQLISDELKKINESPDAGIEYVRKLRKIKTSDYEHTIERFQHFCRERAVINAVKKVATLIKEGKPADSSIVQMFEEALRAGQTNNDRGIHFNKDYKKVIDRVTSVTFGVRTGFPLLDSIWRHGWGAGWLIVPLAPPKRFKSAFCMNMAVNMASHAVGADVFYYSCEIGEDLSSIRGYKYLTKQNDDMVYDSTEKFKTIVKDQIKATMSNTLIVKEFPSKSVTIQDIKTHAKSLISQYGYKPKAIFVDYAETIMPEDPKAPEHRQQSSIYVAARRMGAELGCCVIMPDRCNKETVGLAVPNMKSFQGSFEKAGAVDVSIGLCGTDEEYDKGIVRYFVFLNRHGKAYQHLKGRAMIDTMTLTVDEEIPYVPDEGTTRSQGSSGKPVKKSKSASQDYESLPDELAD